MDAGAHRVSAGHSGSGSESTCTPDSVRTEVRGDHPSRPPIARRLVRPTRGCRRRSAIGRAVLPLFGLAPGGVCRATRVTPGAGALLPHRFTLTCARPGGRAIGGLLSVALSCGSPRLGVTQHHALWSPDVPRPNVETLGRGHPANSLPPTGYGSGERLHAASFDGTLRGSVHCRELGPTSELQ
jgi:hypothetical protein